MLAVPVPVCGHLYEALVLGLSAPDGAAISAGAPDRTLFRKMEGRGEMGSLFYKQATSNTDSAAPHRNGKHKVNSAETDETTSENCS